MSRIEKLGAVVRVLTVNYDDTVVEAQEEAERIAKKNRPVQFIQDTTFENYEVSMYISYTFSSNQIVHQSLFGLCFWVPDLLINRFY